MRTLSLYRILLPPLFIFRICWPWPHEDDSGYQVRDGTPRKRQWKLSPRDYFSERYPAFPAAVGDEGAGVSRLTAENLEEIMKDAGIFRRRLGEFTKILPAFDAPVNLNDGSKNVVPLKTTSVYHFNKERIRIHRNAGLETKRHLQQHKKVLERKGELHKNLNQKTKTASKGELIKAKTSVDRKLLHTLNFPRNETQLRNSRHQSPKKRGIRQAKTPRTRRAVSETVPFQRSKFRPSHISPPEYIVDLFRLLSGTHYEALRNFVVTGFVNLNEDTDSLKYTQVGASRPERLVFDVHISEATEIVQYAELKLFFTRKNEQQFLVQSGNRTVESRGQVFRISVFESSQGRSSESEREHIAVKTTAKAYDTWLSFNFTSVIRKRSSSHRLVLELVADVCESADLPNNELACDSRRNGFDYLTLNLENDRGKGPLLVIFSKKLDSQEQVSLRRTVRDTAKGKEDIVHLQNKDARYRSADIVYEDKETPSDAHYFQGVAEFLATVNTDSSDKLANSIMETLLHASYQQSITKGVDHKLINNAYSNTFPNVKEKYSHTSNASEYLASQLHRKDALLTSRAMNSRFQKRYEQLMDHHAKRLSTDSETVKLPEDIMWRKVKRDTKVRYRRHVDSLLSRGARFKRSKKKRASCQRDEMYVNMMDIKWDNVILFPRGYQAFQCTGKCYAPISEYLTPTKHAILQTLVHTSSPEKASRACCVPTKLDPISVVYLTDDGGFKYDYNYEEMVVAECGCR